MQANYNIVLQAGSDSITENSLITADTPNPLNVDLPAAKAGALTTRTDANTGIITLASGHGITTSHIVDLYDTAGTTRIRKNMTVTAADDTTITVDGGSGTDLPVVSTPLNVGRQIPFLPTILPDTIQLLGIQLKLPGAVTVGRVCFKDDSDVIAGSGAGDIDLVANAGQIFNVAGGAANPLAGDPVESGVVSHGNKDLPAVLTIISLEDRTP